MNRRTFLTGVGAVGAGGVAIGGIVWWRRTGGTTITSEDRETTISPPDDDDPSKEATEIELVLPKGDLDRYNSDSVTVTDGSFSVCNRGSNAARVWLEADPIENTNGEPSVRFTSDGHHDSYLDTPDGAVSLDPDECLDVGVVTRTHGLAQGVTLVDRVDVRTDRSG